MESTSRLSRAILGSQGGFTLLETVIAMSIMVVALASILSVESNCINASARAKTMNVVAMLARNKMVEYEYKVQGKTFDEINKEQSGTFEEPFNDYRWKFSVKELKFPDLGLGGGGQGGDSGQTDAVTQLTRLFTNFLSKAIREITVTVVWSRGGKDQNFAVSTYWVDLNHEFSLSE